MPVKVKICGNTQPEQVQAIAALGADYIGCIIDFAPSPRSLTPQQAQAISDVLRNSTTQVVGVVVNKPLDDLLSLIKSTGIRTWQLHGDEDAKYIEHIKKQGVQVWKSVRSIEEAKQSSAADALLVDAAHPEHGRGGSGKLADWQLAKDLQEQGLKVVLSGGLSTNNIEQAIQAVRPTVVDASSKLEVKPGVKDMALVKKFIDRVRSTG